MDNEWKIFNVRPKLIVLLYNYNGQQALLTYLIQFYKIVLFNNETGLPNFTKRDFANYI